MGDRSYDSIGYTNNKAMISRDVLFGERKGWNWLNVSKNTMQNGENLNIVRTILQEDQVREVA